MYQAFSGILSILLRHTVQQTPMLARSIPQAWPLFLALGFLEGSQSQSRVPVLSLALGSFQGPGKNLQMKRSLEEHLTQG